MRLIEQKEQRRGECISGMASALTTCRHSSVGIIHINSFEQAADFSFSKSQGDLNPLRVSYSICFSVNPDAGKCVSARTLNCDDAEHCLAITRTHTYSDDYLVWRCNVALPAPSRAAAHKSCSSSSCVFFLSLLLFLYLLSSILFVDSECTF